MRKNLLKISLALLLLPGLCLVSSCKKVSEKCENWQFYDVCTPKTTTANCYEYVDRVSNICGAELEDAHEGKTSLIYENSTKRIDRHYVKQVN